MTIKPSDILKGSRFIISNPKHWTQGRHAQTEGGRAVNFNSHDACSFCSIGAMRLTVSKITRGQGIVDALTEAGTQYTQAQALVLSAARKMFNAQDVFERDRLEYPDTVPYFNDSNTHEHVLQAFDIAIEDALKLEGDDIELANQVKAELKENDLLSIFA